MLSNLCSQLSCRRSTRRQNSEGDSVLVTPNPTVTITSTTIPEEAPARVQTTEEEATIVIKKRDDVNNILNELVENNSGSSLRRYEKIKKLIFSIQRTYFINTSGSNNKLELILKLLGSQLPALEEVTFILPDEVYQSSGESTRMYLPVAGFHDFVKESSGVIKKIKFHHLFFLHPQLDTIASRKEFYSHDNENSNLWTVLTQLKMLEVIEVNTCWETTFWGDGTGGKTSTDMIHWKPLIGTLTNMQSIQTIIIKLGNICTACTDRRRCGSEALLPLLSQHNLPHLEHIEIKGLELSADTFLEIAPLLQIHPKLHTFQWDYICFFNPQAKEVFVELLTHNTQLQKLEFTPIFANINTTRFGWPDANYDGITPTKQFLTETIPKALKNNNGIKKCQINLFPRISNIGLSMALPFEVQAAWLELVKHHNFVLEELTLNCHHHGYLTSTPDRDMQQSFQHYLNLNKLGRKQQLQQSEHLTQDDWIEALQKATDINLSCIYDVLLIYFSSNPSSTTRNT